MRRKMENTRRCNFCSIDFHRASYAKRLRSEKHLEAIRQNEIFITEWLFKEEQTPIKERIQKIKKLENIITIS